MKIFSDLGEAIERRWCALDYDEAKLPRIAEEALRRFVPTRVASAESIVRWLLEAPQVPAQHADASFGDPPVMVFRGTRFFIEVLFWLDGRTAIHQHGFSGAFMVLGGSSIHTHYRFEPSKKVNSSIQVGALRRTKVELLRKGDIRQILAGNRLIHATFHLERPTLTIVVRTPSESTGTPQYHYLPPAIATVGSRDIPTRLDRQLKLLATLRQCGSKAFATSAAIFLRRTDYLGATLLFQRHYEELRQWSPAILKRLLNVARSQHGKLVDVWAPVFAEQTRQKHLIRWRAQLQAPDHRFFAAALMNLADRASILALVRQRNPRRDPKKLVLAWVKELFPSFGAGSLIVLGWLLDGLSWPRIAERVRNAVAPGDFAHQKRNTRALVRRLQRSLLSPLMTG